MRFLKDLLMDSLCQVLLNYSIKLNLIKTEITPLKIKLYEFNKVMEGLKGQRSGGKGI
jgi:hypothetical protein